MPYNGGPVFFGLMVLRSVEDTVRDWALVKNGCTVEPTETYHNGYAVCNTWSGCREGSDTVLCTIKGMQHCWPGGGCPLLISGTGNNDINANDAIWSFFKRFQLPAGVSNATRV